MPPGADVAIHASAKTGPGGSVTLTLQASNAGPLAAQAVTVVDTLPNQLAYVSSSTTKGTCAWTALSRTLTCSIGVLVPGEKATVTVKTNETKRNGGADDTATVATLTFDPHLTNNTSTVHIKLR